METRAVVVTHPISLKMAIQVSFSDEDFYEMTDGEACALIDQIQSCIRYMADRDA